MKRLLILALLLCPAGLTAAPVPAGSLPKNVTELPIPTDTMLVIQWNGIERSRNRIAETAAASDAKQKDTISKSIDDYLKKALEGRDVEGLDRKGRLFLIVHDFSDFRGGDALAVALPITDYKTFREKFLTAGERKSFEKGKDGIDEIEFQDRPMYLVDKKDHVFVSRSKETAELVKGKFESMPLAKLGGLAEPFLNADVAIYFNTELINLKYENEIQQIKQVLPLIAQQGGGMGIGKRQLDQMKTVLEGMIQGFEDSKGLQLALEFRPTGMNVRIDLRVKPNSTTGKILADEKPTSLTSLGELPRGMTSYTASRSGAGMSKISRVLDTKLVPSDDDEKGKAAIEKYLDYVANPAVEMRSMSTEKWSLQTFFGPEMASMSDAYAKVIKNLDTGSRFNGVVVKNQPKFKDKAEKLGDFAFHHALIELDFEATVAEIKEDAVREATLAGLKKASDEKQNVWFGSDGKSFHIITASKWDDAKKNIEGLTSVKTKAIDDPAFAKARKEMPAEATYLNLMELNNLTESLATTLGGVAGSLPGVEIPKIDVKKGDPAYLGLSLVAKPEYFRFDIFIPSDVVKYFKDSLK